MPVESFFGDASLAFIASTESAKEGTAYSMKPTDGSGDFTFTRGSNLSATYVGKDGYIKKGYENFLLRSNQFDTSPWASIRASITSGQAGYDGSNDAWLLESTDGTLTSLVKQDINRTGVKTISVYAKSNTANWILLYAIGGSLDSWFDVQNGATGGKGSGAISSSIESVGNDWWRCSVTTNNSITDFRIYVADANNSFNSVLGSSVYIQDAMLNQGLVAYPYLETTTATAINALTDDEPRYDWSSGSAALLLEPNRTNVVPRSEYGFVTGNASIDYNNTISPEGYQNAFKSTATNTLGVFTRIYDISGGATNPVISAFLKYGNNPWLNIIYSGDANSYFNFNCQTGEFGSNIGSSITNLKAEDYGNGWWRVSAKFNYTGGGSYRIYMASSGTTGFAQGNTTIGNYFYGYGFQVEQNATYPSSYIPTYGTIEERLQDILGGVNSNTLFNPSQGVWYLNLYYSVPSNEQHITLHTGSSNHIRIRLYPNGQYLITSNNYSVDVGTGAGGLNIQNSFYKVAIKYDNGNISAFFNGQKIDAYTGTYTPFTSLTSMNFYTYYNTPSSIYTGAVKQTMYFPTALSDDDCITLTTP
jgi:hypothetical protein